MRCENCGAPTPRPHKVILAKRSTTPQTYEHVVRYYCEQCYQKEKRKP
jgi:hypothetical protein